MNRRFKVKDRSGQALVEFALVLPILMLLVVGLIEMARAWNLHQVITDASREACRKAVIYDPSVTQAQVDSIAINRIASAGFYTGNVTITYPDGFHTGANNVTSCRITVPYTFGLLKPIIQGINGTGTIMMATEARMRNE